MKARAREETGGADIHLPADPVEGVPAFPEERVQRALKLAGGGALLEQGLDPAQGRRRGIEALGHETNQGLKKLPLPCGKGGLRDSQKIVFTTQVHRSSLRSGRSWTPGPGAGRPAPTHPTL